MLKVDGLFVHVLFVPRTIRTAVRLFTYHFAPVIITNQQQKC